MNLNMLKAALKPMAKLNQATNTPRVLHVETTSNGRFYVVSTWNTSGVRSSITAMAPLQ